MTDSRLIVALDVADAITGLTIAERIGDQVGWYKIGLAMLTGGGLALANELKDQHGKHILLDLKLYDAASTIETAVRGLARNGVDALTVHGDPGVVRAAKRGASGTSVLIYAVTMLTPLNRSDLDANLMKEGEPGDIAVERSARAVEAGADGIVCAPEHVADVRARNDISNLPIIADDGHESHGNGGERASSRRALERGASQIVVGRVVTDARDPAKAARSILADIA